MSKALFDPGFCNCLTSFSSNVEFLYSELETVKNFTMKKMQYKRTAQRLIKLIDTHVGFYVGCMIWGAYLKTLGEKKIIGNPFLEMEWDKELSLSEVNYIFEFVKKFDKDSKYYLGKPYKFDDKKVKVLNQYIEFLEKNEGFSKCDTTDKIVLVGNLENLDKKEIKTIEAKIQDVITSGNIDELLEFCDKI